MKKIILILILVLSAFLSNANESEIKIVDGDTLHINNAKVRLFGIDAPEINQSCFDASGQEYPCGKIAKTKLKEFLGDTPLCTIKDMDKYKRILSICYNGNINVNATMVQNGYAMAYKRYSNDYNDFENQAKQNKLGIWQGSFTNPEQYRIKNPRK